jgi:hypothetical protein
MISVDQIRSKLGEYLEDRIQLDELEDWILANGWNVHLDADSQTAQLVHRLLGVILDFDAGAVSIGTLRRELREASNPYPFDRRQSVAPPAKSPHRIHHLRTEPVAWKPSKPSEQSLNVSFLALSFAFVGLSQGQNSPMLVTAPRSRKIVFRESRVAVSS